MMPNTRVSPAAIRNSMTPNCTPFSTCSTRWIIERVPPRPFQLSSRRKPGSNLPPPDRLQSGTAGQSGMNSPRLAPKWIPAFAGMTLTFLHQERTGGLLHLAFAGIGVGVVGEHDPLDLAHVGALIVLDDAQQVEILDREMVVVVFEEPAHRAELGLLERGDQALLVRQIAFDRGDGAIDHRDRIEALRGVERWVIVVLLAEGGDEFLVARVVEIGRPEADLVIAFSGVADRRQRGFVDRKGGIERNLLAQTGLRVLLDELNA